MHAQSLANRMHSVTETRHQEVKSRSRSTTKSFRVLCGIKVDVLDGKLNPDVPQFIIFTVSRAMKITAFSCAQTVCRVDWNETAVEKESEYSQNCLAFRTRDDQQFASIAEVLRSETFTRIYDSSSHHIQPKKNDVLLPRSPIRGLSGDNEASSVFLVLNQREPHTRWRRRNSFFSQLFEFQFAWITLAASVTGAYPGGNAARSINTKSTVLFP